MFRSKLVRLILVLLFLGGAAAITWSVISRRPDQPRQGNHTLLTADQQQRLTGAIYWERKAGKVSFQVKADYSIESNTGVFSLEKVNVVHYDEQGQAANLVSGDRAVYRTEEKDVEVTGNVTLKLADGTDVFSEAVFADLDKETVRIGQAFRFKRGDAEGEGERLLYQIPNKLLNIEGRFALRLPSDDGVIDVKARDALYNMNARTVDLSGSASVVGSGRELRGDRIHVQMDEQNHIQEMIGEGTASLLADSGKQFTGKRITLRADPVTRRMTHFEVHGEEQRRAIYEEKSDKGLTVIESDHMIGIPSDADTGNRTEFQRFDADGSVVFRSEPLGIARAKSDRVTGWFYPGGQELQRVDLLGNASVLRRLTDRKGVPSEETVTSRDMQIQFLPDRVVREARAISNVTFTVKKAGGQRVLTASEQIRVEYKNGLMDRVVSEGNSVIQEESEGIARTARAPRFEGLYEAGALKSVRGEGGVSLEDRKKDRSTARSWSDKLVASYDAGGALTEIVQEGNVRHLDERPETTVEAKAPFSRYDAREEVLTVQGTPAIARYLRQASGNDQAQNTETRANTITFRQKTEAILAQGNVQSVFQQKDGLVVVRAGRMEADRKTSWVVYSESPRITRETSSIAGREVRYNDSDQQLFVTGQVDSRLAATDKSGRKYHVVADRLVYDRTTAKARYEGAVQVTSEDLVMKAPFLELVFESEKSEDLREVVAWGGVVVWQGEKKAVGPKAIYYPDTEKVVMSAGG